MPDAPRCRNCHRPLCDPTSRARGYGGKCWADRQPRRTPAPTVISIRTPRPGRVPGQLRLDDVEDATDG